MNPVSWYSSRHPLFVMAEKAWRLGARFGEGHSFVSAFVNGKELNVFASEGTKHDWFQSIYRFTSTDARNRDASVPAACRFSSRRAP